MEKKLQMLPQHKAQAILALCWSNIVNPPAETALGPNLPLPKRGEFLKDIRVRLNGQVEKLNAEADRLKVDNNVNKMLILEELNDVMSLVQIIDNYKLDNILKTCTGNLGAMTHSFAKNVVNFPIEFEGEKMIVNCTYYEEISLNNDLLAEFLNAEDEQELLKFAQKHIILANVCMFPEKDIDKENMQPITNPVFANIDPAYQVDKKEIVEV